LHRRLLVLLVLLVSAAIVAPWAAATARRDAAAPTGDRAGLALLGRIHRAYADVPAVAVSGRAGTLSFRVTIVLRSGVGIAEEVVSREPGLTTMVARGSGPTYARAAGSSCWRPLARTDPEAVDDLGLPFPDQPAMRVQAPRTTPTGTVLPVASKVTAATFSVDRSFRVPLITVGAGGSSLVEHVAVLSSAPGIPQPEPRC
jgi:hypothetical protein